MPCLWKTRSEGLIMSKKRKHYTLQDFLQPKPGFKSPYSRSHVNLLAKDSRCRRSKRQRKKILKKAGVWLTPDQSRRFLQLVNQPPALIDKVIVIPMHRSN